jgi:hypothetical protein
MGPSESELSESRGENEHRLKQRAVLLYARLLLASSTSDSRACQSNRETLMRRTRLVLGTATACP